MDKFVNLTDLGNEKALKRGSRVPDGAINLAWAKAPKLTPENNIIVVDTSRIVEENAVREPHSCKLMYANSIGILEDQNGNQVISDEFPAVADVFSVDEDFSLVPGSEYKDEDILPFVHISRYFHVDFPGLTLGTILQSYQNDYIKIVDENGKDYLREDGSKKYRIQITPANLKLNETTTDAAYRVYAFVDTNDNENLYLTYNKIEITAAGGLSNQQINHKEILNPVPYFEYKPEETDVIEPRNRNRKWYSTKPVTLKQQVLNQSYSDVDGYKVYVPRKAIGDTRLFQLFRWRVSCDFVENYQVDPSRDVSTIRAGVISIGGMSAPYCFYNMENTQFNATKITFTSPLGEKAGLAKTSAAYWAISSTDLTTNQAALAQYDVLVWAPTGTSFDFTPYLGFIKYFTETLGKTLIIDTHNFVVPIGLGIQTSVGLSPSNGVAFSSGAPYSKYAAGSTIRPTTTAYTTPFLDGDGQVGGWELNDGTPDELNSISPFKNGTYGYGYAQAINPNGYPADFQKILVATATDGSGTELPVMIDRQTTTGGHLIFSTIGLAKTPNSLYDDISGKILFSNTGSTIQSTAYYNRYINVFSVEGAIKLFNNVCLIGVKGTILDDSDQRRYSSAWTFSSPWKASWVIKGEVLDSNERNDNDFVFMPKDANHLDLVWQRSLTDKTLKQLIDENLTAKDLQRIAGAQRLYRIEVTNDLVKTPDVLTLNANLKPYAWTEAYSPPFKVPVELGPHIIKSEEVQGEYAEGQYVFKAYPPKPFKLQVQTNFNDTSEALVTRDVTLTATGSATAVTTTTTPVIDVDTELRWTSHGSGAYYGSSELFEYGEIMPLGINSWQQCNYYTNQWGPGNLMWPHYGIYGVFDIGSQGEVVAFMQQAFNVFQFLGFFDTGVGYLAVDGYYGPQMKAAVYAFQATFQARYYDGTVDAETLSIIGAQIIRLGEFAYQQYDPSDYRRFFIAPFGDKALVNISDGNDYTSYKKRSWIYGGPSIIWELYGLTFNQGYNIHSVSLTPVLEGATQNLMWRSIHILDTGGADNLRNTLTNYNSQWGQAIYMPYRPVNGQKFDIAIGPYYGNTVIVGVGQDGGTGIGSSRMLGIKELTAHAITQEGGQTVTVRNTVALSFSTSARVTTGQKVTIQANPSYSGAGYLENVQWSSISTNNPLVSATISSTGVITLTHNTVVENNDTMYSNGPVLPPATNTLFSINENSKASPILETGWITKTDGIKLLCNSSGGPTGFPALPTTIGPYEEQRHYTSLTIHNLGQDPSVLVGFYDFNAKEFITNKYYQGEMSYLEYLRRGPQNIYIGIISTYEVDTNKTLPPATDAPPLPYKWAMPVYGVCVKTGSKICIEPLPADLGPTDLWSLPIRAGKFNKVFNVRSLNNGPIDGWLRNYQGKKIRAFYSVPEAENGPWSTIFGRPNIDVVDEHPIIIDDDIIQVKQAPILMVKEPTAINTNADPLHPIFTISVKDSVVSDWRVLLKSEVKDYNISNGFIYLNSPLPTADSNFVKISYTTPSKVYSFKQYDGNILNLNPYPGHTRDLIGHAIYVYIVPEYIKDDTNRIVQDSVTTKAVRFTLDPGIFDPMDPSYSPLAIELGVVYITPSLKIEDLIILDTRTRGGGAAQTRTKEEIGRIIKESVGYWDIGFGAGLSYQKAGFIIVRLPEALKDQFPNRADIDNAIRRNLTVGVEYKLEDLQGRNWS